jgi:hypothetical protein
VANGLVSEPKNSGVELRVVLTQEHMESGLYLEQDEDFIYLCDKDRIIHAVFSSRGATIEAMREEADRIMAEEVYQQQSGEDK